jgi:hypothetical protein
MCETISEFFSSEKKLTLYSTRDFFTRSEKMGRVGCETMNEKDTKQTMKDKPIKQSIKDKHIKQSM